MSRKYAKGKSLHFDFIKRTEWICLKVQKENTPFNRYENSYRRVHHSVYYSAWIWLVNVNCADKVPLKILKLLYIITNSIEVYVPVRRTELHV